MYDAACLFQKWDHILLLAMIDHISIFLCLLQDFFVGRIVTAAADMEHRVGVLCMDPFGRREIQVDTLFLQDSGCKLEEYCLAFRIWERWMAFQIYARSRQQPDLRIFRHHLVRFKEALVFTVLEKDAACTGHTHLVKPGRQRLQRAGVFHRSAETGNVGDVLDF